MSAKEIDRLSMVQKIIDKRLTQALGAQQLGLTIRQENQWGQHRLIFFNSWYFRDFRSPPLAIGESRAINGVSIN